eukprot:351624-Chlamydomonas_euryale.AAC.3
MCERRQATSGACIPGPSFPPPSLSPSPAPSPCSANREKPVGRISVARSFGMQAKVAPASRRPPFQKPTDGSEFLPVAYVAPPNSRQIRPFEHPPRPRQASRGSQREPLLRSYYLLVCPPAATASRGVGYRAARRGVGGGVGRNGVSGSLTADAHGGFGGGPATRPPAPAALPAARSPNQRPIQAYAVEAPSAPQPRPPQLQPDPPKERERAPTDVTQTNFAQINPGHPNLPCQADKSNACEGIHSAPLPAPHLHRTPLPFSRSCPTAPHSPHPPPPVFAQYIHTCCVCLPTQPAVWRCPRLTPKERAHTATAPQRLREPGSKPSACSKSLEGQEAQTTSILHTPRCSYSSCSSSKRALTSAPRRPVRACLEDGCRSGRQCQLQRGQKQPRSSDAAWKQAWGHV